MRMPDTSRVCEREWNPGPRYQGGLLGDGDARIHTVGPASLARSVTVGRVLPLQELNAQKTETKGDTDRSVW